MIPGDPYRNDDLDEYRARQRLALSAIPDWLLDPGRFGVHTSFDYSGLKDRSRVETLVRRLLDELLARREDLIQPWIAQAEAFRLAWFLAHDSQMGADVSLLQTLGTLTDLADSKVDEVGEPPTAYDPDDAPDIASIILLLTLAEGLADDEYTDPRLAIPQ